MKLINQTLLLDESERALLALACGAGAVPALTVEAFTNWLANSLPEHESALAHGARTALFGKLRTTLCCSAGSGGNSGGRIWCVTRHPGALGWLHAQGIRPHRVVPHIGEHEVEAGDVVIGVLPPALTAALNARAVRCLQIVLPLAAHDRGRELCATRMRALGAHLVELEVRCKPVSMVEIGRARP